MIYLHAPLSNITNKNSPPIKKFNYNLFLHHHQFLSIFWNSFFSFRNVILITFETSHYTNQVIPFYLKLLEFIKD